MPNSHIITAISILVALQLWHSVHESEGWGRGGEERKGRRGEEGQERKDSKQQGWSWKQFSCLHITLIS